jgi:hypothetical protein
MRWLIYLTAFVTAVTLGQVVGPTVALAQDDPALGPYLMLPEWGDAPGGRVALPDGTAAITFPDDWHAMALTEERKAEILAVDPTAADRLRLSMIWVMAETIGVDPHEMCQLMTVADPGGEPIAERGEEAAAAAGYGATFEVIDLPVGPALLLRFSYGVTSPFFQGSRELHNRMFVTNRDDDVFYLICSSVAPPTDEWRSIAASLEWIGPEPRGDLHLPPRPAP